MTQQADGDSHPQDLRTIAQITAIRRRLEEINAGVSAYADETDELIQKLRTLEASLEEPHRHLRLLPPLAVIGAGASAGGQWVARHGRSVSAGALTVGAAGIIAGALLAHGSAAPHARGGPQLPLTAPSGVPAVSLTPGAWTPPSRAVPRPTRTPSGPPIVPVVVPRRGRRPSAAPSPAQPPVGPDPTPSRPASPWPSPSAPSSTRKPTPQPSPCPIGLSLRITALGLSVCI